MKKTLSLKIDTNFYDRLASLAAKKGVSKSFLVRKGLENLLLQADELADLTLFHETTLALQKNKPLPFSTDWQRIEQELAESTPRWPSADDAMRYSRKKWKP